MFSRETARHRITPLSAPAHRAPAVARSSFQQLWNNQTMQHLLRTGKIQAQLAIRQPGDSYEQEADRVADEVIRMSKPSGPGPTSVITSLSGSGAQRKCAACAVGGATCPDCSDENEVQRKEAEAAGPQSLRSSMDRISWLPSGGAPLPRPVRAFFEPRFGRDFSTVRIHTGRAADIAARSIHALAYTSGCNVVFRDGQFSPATQAGRHLIAHELTHVIQQRSMGPGLQRQADGLEPPEETEAVSGGAEDLPSSEDFGEEEPSEVQLQQGDPCRRSILAEGTCEHLACRSRWSCCNPDSGIHCPGKTSSSSSDSCPSERWTPLFTCDANCETALENGCEDNDHWMAIPGSQFNRSRCGQWYTICANGRTTTARVRDRSVTASRYEVSPGVQMTLGVTVGASFRGSIYRPGADEKIIRRDRCCNRP